MSENRMMRIFGPKWEEVTGEQIEQRNEELNDLYSSPKIVRVIESRRMRWAGMQNVSGRAEAYTGFWWENLKEKNPFRNPGIRLEDNIKMDLQEVGCEGMDQIDPAQDRDSWRALVNAVMNFRVK